MKFYTYLFLFFLCHNSKAQTLLNDAILSNDIVERLGWVTSLSADGNIVAIGGPANSDISDANGAVFVYQNNNGAWTQLGQTLYGDPRDEFGTDVKISADGNRLLAFSSRNNIPKINGFGKIDVYEFLNQKWVKIGQTILPQKNSNLSQTSTNLTPDGKRIIHKEFNKDTLTLRILELQDKLWVEIENQLQDSQTIGSGFTEIASSYSGDTIVLGYRVAQLTGKICVWTNQDSKWSQLGDCVFGKGLIDTFGGKLDMSYDGKTIIVGGTNEGTPFDNDKTVRILHFQNGKWEDKGNSIPPNTIEDLFGFQVAISKDGNVVAISGKNNSDVFEDGGHVQVHKFIDGQWHQVGEDIYGQKENAHCGYGLDLSADGGTVAIGCPFHFTETGGLGQVLIYDMSIPLSVSAFQPNKIKVFPNPTTAILYIDCNLDCKYEIFNAVGIQVMGGLYQQEINVESLANGMYHLRVEQDGLIYSNKFVKF